MSVVDDRRETVAIYESKLAEEKARRDKILADKRAASARADAGDRQARLEVASLDKQDAAAGRLVRSIEMQLASARKFLAMAMDQAAAVEAKRISADTLPRDKWFAVSCPDGRAVRHRHSSMDALQKELQPGYRAIGQVFGHNEDGTGGFVSTPGAPSMMKALLEANGDDLIAFLAERGIKSITA
jgi:hypothetical protein